MVVDELNFEWAFLYSKISKFEKYRMIALEGHSAITIHHLTSSHESTMLLEYLCIFLSFWAAAEGANVKGKLDLSPFNVTRKTVANTDFKLIQVGGNDGHAYVAHAKIHDLDGNFKFENVPEPAENTNSSTFFVLQASSLEFNLKPNRILVSIERDPQDATRLVTKAFRNVFGKENFPSPEIQHPEKLEEIPLKSHIPITLVNKAPLRMYVQERNASFLKSGPIAGILNSKFKLAALITGVIALIFPTIFSKLETAGALSMAEDKLLQQQVQKQSDQKEVQSELENIKAKA
ncbi:LAME_0G03554g1_1 [Lachancea meyersii CBS 8951]|uniref:Protein SOP4 n=1 Tax=Lachancea meyersii CBS 8951 TaxID=1266667 RepID=A0A1G4K6P5_9SACH|nr:LAME_0G03554g1_1 [Lachancea meyersii CBS 8951]